MFDWGLKEAGLLMSTCHSRTPSSLMMMVTL
jgi:hypothetical protein